MTRVNPWWTGDLGQAHAINDLDDELARRLSLDLTVPLLRSRLDRLESGLAAPEAVVRTVRRRGLAVEITREGHDPEQVDAIARRIDLDFEPIGPSKPVITGFAVALGAIALLFLVFGQWFLAILSGLLVLVPLYIDRSGRTKAADAQARRDDQLARLRADLLQAREDVERREREAAELDTATRGALERLREAPPADPGPPLHGLR
ncbi:hypothetical protein K3N28_17500 [Glycomyces sp. TRM65418]|uniref:hypothetical protein n=1 Tax=Glycomyces sp. TRM65418 TaxID=2867006 RepID=UPI001CE70DA0|nr:hypothetical protein [Glycomyces sp. TRM65418]MCC3764856.1 hypothetical protein [Glycomyces sp. TRM65418]QZD54503.1 hypothetical protein K3N28_17415 [Glycomyces sp. TRM65418]